jgi:hypothetical protein
MGSGLPWTIGFRGPPLNLRASKSALETKEQTLETKAHKKRPQIGAFQYVVARYVKPSIVSIISCDDRNGFWICRYVLLYLRTVRYQ